MSRHHSRIRARKQHFPRPDRRQLSGSMNESSSSPPDDFFPSDDEQFFHSPPKRVPPKNSSHCSTTKHGSSSSSSLTDPNDLPLPVRQERKARDEHNEQERNRRRELAIIYELIRCSFTPHDLRHLVPEDCPRSIDRLSYPQVLHIAHNIMKEEQHNFALYERALGTLDLLERELQNNGMAVPKRPYLPSPMENYKKVIQVVDDLLKQDKSERTHGGTYQYNPTERAAMGDHQLSLLSCRRGSATCLDDYYSNSRPSLRAMRRRSVLPYNRSENYRMFSPPIRSDGVVSSWGGVKSSLKRPASIGSFGYTLRDGTNPPSDYRPESLSPLDPLSPTTDNTILEEPVFDLMPSRKQGRTFTPPHLN